MTAVVMQEHAKAKSLEVLASVQAESPIGGAAGTGAAPSAESQSLWVADHLMGNEPSHVNAAANYARASNGDACSGKVSEQSELTARSDVMAKIAMAVQKAEGKTRFFRKFTHWLLAFHRYAPAAIAAEQWPQVAIANRVDTISRLAERQSAWNPKLGYAVAIHYESFAETEP